MIRMERDKPIFAYNTLEKDKIPLHFMTIMDASEQMLSETGTRLRMA